MKLFESILDDIEAQTAPAAGVLAQDDGPKDPFDDDGEFDVLLSIPVTVVDGKDYDRVKCVQERLYDFLEQHPAVPEYSRIMIATNFHFFEDDPDVSHELSNRLNRYDTVFQVAIKCRFRNFMDVASFIVGINSIVKHIGAANCPIQFLRRDPETGRFYFDERTWNTGIKDHGVEMSYFHNETVLNAKNRHLNVREFIDIIQLCEMLTNGHVTMQMFNKAYAGVSFSLRSKVFEGIMGDTLRRVNVSGLYEFISNNQMDTYALGETLDPTNLGVVSYFQVVPLDYINQSNFIEGRFGIGYKKTSSDSQRQQTIDFLQKKFDGCPIDYYDMERKYIRGTIYNAPVRLAMWLGVTGIPGYTMPCAVAFVLGVDRPDKINQTEEFMYRFRRLFKTVPDNTLVRKLTDNLLEDARN